MTFMESAIAFDPFHVSLQGQTSAVFALEKEEQGSGRTTLFCSPE